MSYRFALRPRWLLSHVLAVASVVALASLGLWQLDRHDQRAARNATVEARADLPVAPALEALDSVDDPEQLRFRRLTAEGTYGDEVLLVDNRSLDGLPGAWVLAPFELADGSVLAVNRGFRFSSGGAVEAPAAPDGRVRIEGTVAVWAADDCGVRRDDDGRPLGSACLNPSAAAEAFGTDVLPIVVQRQASDPAEADVLEAVPAPELDAGPHRSYAFQWFTFATLAAVTYLLILRRVSRAGPAT
ncbi:MAG TPA: SURF1 family protein [Acidimicrobiales bacterium]|nr:SURF1 family protein [Acidimicrobiales bacterium]